MPSKAEAKVRKPFLNGGVVGPRKGQGKAEAVADGQGRGTLNIKPA